MRLVTEKPINQHLEFVLSYHASEALAKSSHDNLYITYYIKAAFRILESYIL